VQFRCADNTCTHIAGRCNGVNNCADGSDEQGCATTTTGLTLEAYTGFTATIETPAVGSSVFYDRTYTFDSLGSFTGHSFIMMSNEDKHIRHSHVQMKLRLPQPLTVYIAKLDSTPLPWLAAEGWAESSLTGVSYHGVRQTRHTDWSGVLNEDHYGPGAVWQKTFTAGAIELRGNGGGDGSYVMFVAHPSNAPTPPVTEGLWEPVLGSENGERVKCNSNVNMEYVADQAACQQLAINNGHPFYSFRHNGESSGHKCMSSSHCDDHLTERTNEWHIYAAGGYHYGVVASNVCESHDVSEAECLAAVQSLLPEGVVQGRTHLVAGSWGWVPPGCSVQSHFTHGQNGDWAAHYNRNEHGNNDGGYTPVCNSLGDEWTVVQGAATSAHANVNVGAAAFNEMFAACPVVRYTNPPMAGSPAVYKRHSRGYPGDAHSLFTHLWAKQNNQFHTDFDIYPSLEDARAGTNAWQFCNFADEPQPNHFTVGFPRDCGPTVYQPHIWFHATRASGTQTSGFFEIYTGGNCPA